MVGRPFPPGVSGNPSGRPKSKLWTDAIRRAVERVVEISPGVSQTRLDALAEALVAAGLAGEVQAQKEVGDRLEGKVPQALVGAEDEPPILTEVRVVIVDPQS